MKQVKLFDFFKRLADEGVDLTGCRLEYGQDNYHIFIGISEDRVKVKYGTGHKQRGSMGEGLLVSSISLSSLLRKQPGMVESKNSSISVRFV